MRSRPGRCPTTLLPGCSTGSPQVGLIDDAAFAECVGRRRVS